MFLIATSIPFLKTSRDGDSTSYDSWFWCITFLSENIFFPISNLTLQNFITSVYLCLWKIVGDNRSCHRRRLGVDPWVFWIIHLPQYPGESCCSEMHFWHTFRSEGAMHQTQPVAMALPLIFCGHCWDHCNEVPPCCSNLMLDQALGELFGICW